MVVGCDNSGNDERSSTSTYVVGWFLADLQLHAFQPHQYWSITCICLDNTVQFSLATVFFIQALVMWKTHHLASSTKCILSSLMLMRSASSLSQSLFLPSNTQCETSEIKRPWKRFWRNLTNINYGRETSAPRILASAIRYRWTTA